MDNIAYNIGVQYAIKTAGLGDTLMRMGSGALKPLRVTGKQLIRGAEADGIKGFGKALWNSPLKSNTVSGALIGGGINAYTAQDGDRLNAFGRGAGYGALGGLAYAGAHGAMTGARQSQLGRGLLGSKGARTFGQKLLNFGTKPGLAGLGASMTVPTGAAPQIRQQPLTTYQ